MGVDDVEDDDLRADDWKRMYYWSSNGDALRVYPWPGTFKVFRHDQRLRVDTQRMRSVE